ncbi:MAG: hypothetical protein D6744_04145, partial [Planctomycetota bacterium]
MLWLIVASLILALTAAVILEERRASAPAQPNVGRPAAPQARMPARDDLRELADRLLAEERAAACVCPDGHPDCLPSRGSVNRYYCPQCDCAFLGASHDLPAAPFSPDPSRDVCPREGCHHVQPAGDERCAACGVRI